MDPISDIIQVEGIFSEGTEIKDYYTEQTDIVKDGLLNFVSLDKIVLLGMPFGN